MLYYASVTNTSGPGAYSELFFEIAHHNLGMPIKTLSDLTLDDNLTFGAIFESYGLEANGLDGCVNFKTGVKPNIDSTASGDRSWTPEGEALQAQRSKAMASEVDELLQRFSAMRLEKAQAAVGSTSSTSSSSTSSSSTSKPLFAPGFLLKPSAGATIAKKVEQTPSALKCKNGGW